MKHEIKVAKVLVDLPRAGPLDYVVPEALDQQTPTSTLLGRLCVVPLGSRKVIGVVVEVLAHSHVPAARLKSIESLPSVPALPAGWLKLTQFAASYYHHGWGETALASMPRIWRSLTGPRREATLTKLRSMSFVQPTSADGKTPKRLNSAQSAAVDAINATQGFACHVLFGVTGSGKTEVYLEAMARRLAQAPGAHVLLLVPEINLTPQLEARVRERFAQLSIVSLHSGLADGVRAGAWLAALEGRARIVLGTRSAIFVPLPALALICIDEEHDPSYKAGDGIRYSARDLAVKRAQLEGVAVVLGSATPSVESWARVRAGRYTALALPQRASAKAADKDTDVDLKTIDLRSHKKQHGLTEPVRAALAATLERGEQSLVFINRRGYAPVLSCGTCGWLSACPRCDAYAAFHRIDAVLRCHHCGWSIPVPSACPSCGNQDLSAVGAGTQRIEESLQACMPDATIARLDRDSTRRADSARQVLDAVHAGTTHVLVGTQMLTKGHDFRRVSTVVVLNVDAQIVSHDFRAAERLFATLTQVIGRAGRAGQKSQILIETSFARHPLFGALAHGDYAAFADAVLAERRHARLPPYVYQALINAESSTLAAAMTLLQELTQTFEGRAPEVVAYDPVPMALSKRANVYRAQLLLESGRRSALHALLDQIDPALTKGRRPAVRMRIEVDPQEI